MFNLFGRSLVSLEVHWHGSGSLEELSQLLPEEVSARKRKLFGCACYRRIWPAVWQQVKEAVELAELEADGLITKQAVDSALAGRVLHWVAPDPSSLVYVARAARERAWHNGRPQRMPWDPGRDRFLRCEEIDQVGLLRHVVGNPFRRFSGPQVWPVGVLRLAEALYAGADVAFALADALLEAGHPELAEHFRAEAWHPKGCWVVDLVLGKS